MANQVQTVPAEDGEAAMPAESTLPWLRIQLEKLGVERILALAVAVLALVGLLAFIAFRAMEPHYTLLYAGMALDDTRAVVQRLEAMGVDHRLTPQGDAVMVPADRVLELRMALASDGVPGGGVVGYEIFDTTDSFGTTEFLSNINLKRAMEGELARTIQSLRAVRTARVHLVQPRRELFRRSQAPASASVFLTVGPGGLGRGEIAAIRHLVAAAVPSLEAGRITVADDQGRLLARGGDSTEGFAGLDDTESYRAVFEGRLQEKILQLLERSVGPGRVEAQVTAELDFDRTTTTEEIYDPDRQVVRSTQLVDETTELDERQPNDRVTVADNLPGGDAGEDAATSSEQRARTEETINYEISRIVRNQTRRGGELERLSVAVQVDGTYRTNEAGEAVFEPLPEDELAELEELVRSAVGIDDARGDTLSIVSRRFATPEPAVGAPEPMLGLGLERQDWYRIGETAGLVVVALMVLLFGVRPLFKRLAKADLQAEAGKGPRLLPAPDGKQLLVHLPGGQTIKIDENGKPMVVGPDGEPIPEPAEPEEERISLKQIEGSVNASMLSEMSDLVKNRPEDAIRVIRSWLHQN